MTLAMVGIYMLLIYLCISALLGIASRRPSSWRKVARSCITFVIPLWISELFIPATGISNLFSFNVYLSTAILYNVLLIMAGTSMPTFFSFMENSAVYSHWFCSCLYGKVSTL